MSHICIRLPAYSAANGSLSKTHAYTAPNCSTKTAKIQRQIVTRCLFLSDNVSASSSFPRGIEPGFPSHSIPAVTAKIRQANNIDRTCLEICAFTAAREYIGIFTAIFFRMRESRRQKLIHMNMFITRTAKLHMAKKVASYR